MTYPVLVLVSVLAIASFIRVVIAFTTPKPDPTIPAHGPYCPCKSCWFRREEKRWNRQTYTLAVLLFLAFALPILALPFIQHH
jgi:hypothetical protein